MSSIHDLSNIIVFECLPQEFKANYEKEVLFDARYDNTWYPSGVTSVYNPDKKLYLFIVTIKTDDIPS